MMEREHDRPAEQPDRFTMTHDYERGYRGLWADGGVCRIRIYQATGGTPVVIATELATNTNTSITNIAGYLAAEVIAAHFPERFEHDEVVTWVEQYPRADTDFQRRLPEFSLVTFASYTPRVAWLGGVERVRIGEPAWRHIGRAELTTRLGLGEDELV